MYVLSLDTFGVFWRNYITNQLNGLLGNLGNALK